ncbi:MAG: NAD(P)-dependent glycerol-3-phosphate dehydrogenase [Acidaminococcaceae bacterium]|nr:NAD(P)-dependent glycerol-3-phosphate dehydrogenase [Acidaminococcaceae bacterium]
MHIGIIGAGTWGMALARMLSNSGHLVEVWSPHSETVDRLAATRTQKNLPDMIIPEEVRFTKEMGQVCKNKDLLVFAVPSIYVRPAARQASPFVHTGQIIVDVSKGIEAETLMTLSEVIRDEVKADVKVVALSGPTHAEEVARDLPGAIVSACEDMAAAEKVQDVFMNSCLRVYTNPDVKGVELCGALKNIIALAAGVSAALGYGDNAKAALITRGLAEISRLGEKLGCARDTFAGLAGMGDLIVTATSMHSRNNRCGYLIGQGYETADAVKRVGMVVEGINALPAAIAFAEKYEVDMPIVRAVDAIVNHNADPRTVVARLMERDKTAERKG